ncbi:MAG: EamA family transporter [Ottowia sp.]|nr:EamA family transporter [Ottowia sp.]
MNASTFSLIFTGVILNACAQLCLKAGVNATGSIALTRHAIWPAILKLSTQWPIAVGLLCYGLSLVVWILGLSRTDVSLAYPMLSLGYVINAIAAWYLFGEVLSMQRIAAIGIILLGVYILARS